MCILSSLYLYLWKLYSVTLNTKSETNNNRILLWSERCPTGWPHDIPIATLALPYLSSFLVCWHLFHTCYTTCGLHSRLCILELQFFYENKMQPKPPSWLELSQGSMCRSACLWAPLHSGCLSVLEDTCGSCATQEENRHYGWKVARWLHFICTFNSSQNNLSKISSSERESFSSNCYCNISQVVTELNRGISDLNFSPSHTSYFAPGKNPVVSKGSFPKVKVLTLAKEALPQASRGLWAQGSQWNIFLQLYKIKDRQF